jgi:NMD protein affecting ribosome stability and mRNA decay
MGQLADDMVEGRSCSECGIYFEKAHGFPVLCRDCYADELVDTMEEPTHPMATEKEL